jgi:nucleoside-diphosphate-sugar epimerase
MEISGYQCKIEEKAPRSYDVSRFCGDPSRAKSILGWEATTTLEQGIANFISDLKEDRI